MKRAIVPKTLDQLRAELYAECRRLAELAWTKYRHCPQRYYLVGTRGPCGQHADVWLSLDIGTDESPLQSVRPEPLSRAVTLDTLTSTIQTWLYREPLWIYAE